MADFTALYVCLGDAFMLFLAASLMPFRACAMTLRMSFRTMFSMSGLLIISRSNSSRCFTKPSISTLSAISKNPHNHCGGFLFPFDKGVLTNEFLKMC
jgi:hypothetical protein